jgi:hypothetical protein
VEEAAAVSNRSVANHVTDVQSTAAKDVRTKAGELDLDVSYKILDVSYKKMDRPLLHEDIPSLTLSCQDRSGNTWMRLTCT